MNKEKTYSKKYLTNPCFKEYFRYSLEELLYLIPKSNEISIENGLNLKYKLVKIFFNDHNKRYLAHIIKKSTIICDDYVISFQFYDILNFSIKKSGINATTLKGTFMYCINNLRISFHSNSDDEYVDENDYEINCCCPNEFKNIVSEYSKIKNKMKEIYNIDVNDMLFDLMCEIRNDDCIELDMFINEYIDTDSNTYWDISHVTVNYLHEKKEDCYICVEQNI